MSTPWNCVHCIPNGNLFSCSACAKGRATRTHSLKEQCLTEAVQYTLDLMQMDSSIQSAYHTWTTHILSYCVKNSDILIVLLGIAFGAIYTLMVLWWIVLPSFLHILDLYDRQRAARKFMQFNSKSASNNHLHQL
jgi:hypothetical protein